MYNTLKKKALEMEPSFKKQTAISHLSITEQNPMRYSVVQNIKQLYIHLDKSATHQMKKE
jgi:hypothetical protein